MPLVRFEFAIVPLSSIHLLFVKDSGLKMTPVTLEPVIDDSKVECKDRRDMENDKPCVPVAA
jgi:hypothetical protein